MIIGKKKFNFEENAYIMGILNITPDSFSDGGDYFNEKDTLERAREIEEQGGTIIDIGGESTRPGATYVEADEEIRRIIGSVRILSRKTDLPLSIDTYKGEVAEAALEAGAHMINDIKGLQGDKKLAEVTAWYQAPVCIMFNRRMMDTTGDIIKDLDLFIGKSLEIARKTGIREENIILDPGIGFGISAAESFRLINNLGHLKKYGYPVLLGASRKRIVWETLSVSAKEGLSGTLSTTAIGVFNGADIIRVHDVRENVQCTLISKKIAINK